MLAFYRLVHQTVRCTTRQSGAPPDMTSAWFLYFFGEADHWALDPLERRTLSDAHRTVRCGLVTVGFSHASPVDHAADRWCGRYWLIWQSGAHRTVRWILAAAPSAIPESSEFIAELAWAPDTIRFTPDSLMHRRLVQVLAVLSQTSPTQSHSIW
jgi:hypothetical protein